MQYILHDIYTHTVGLSDSLTEYITLHLGEGSLLLHNQHSIGFPLKQTSQYERFSHETQWSQSVLHSDASLRVCHAPTSPRGDHEVTSQNSLHPAVYTPLLHSVSVLQRDPTLHTQWVSSTAGWSQSSTGSPITQCKHHLETDFQLLHL